MGTELLTMPIQGMTCASCVFRIEKALRAQEGVMGARVNFAAQEATIAYDPSLFDARQLAYVIERLGYATPAFPGSPGKERPLPPAQRVDAPAWPGSMALVGLYLSLVTLAQDWQHANELIWGDRWLVAAIALGFGVQIGLYTHLRRLMQRQHQLGQCKTLTAAGTGSSSLAMVACCLHHLTDVLPILGLSAAAVFLNQYRVPFMLVGIGTNLVGIAMMLRLIRKVSAQAQSGGPRSRPSAPLAAHA
jgi:cation transport ATPase